MDKQEHKSILVNRIVAFLAGGLLVFTVMNITVVNTANGKNRELAAALDISRYEPGRLLTDAQAQFKNRNYDKAEDSLNKLLETRPGSSEAVAGKELLADVKTAVTTADMRWNNASATVQTKWFTDRTAELRAESDKERGELEAGMKDKISKEWEQSKDKIRAKWELEN